MFHLVLYHPKIPPNTGNVIRLAANTGAKLHLIEPLGFDFEEKQLRRAGLDYHDIAKVSRHGSFDDFMADLRPDRIFAVTTKGSVLYTAPQYQVGDVFVFGSETHGLPDSIFDAIGKHNCIRLPMQPNNRSLNLSNAVAVIVYEAWRQTGFSAESTNLA